MIDLVKKFIFEILDENGIYIDSDEMEKDLDLRDYLLDSLQYIYFVVELENKLGVELPDEMLIYDHLSSINGFANMIQNAIYMDCDNESNGSDSDTANEESVTCCIINMSNC